MNYKGLIEVILKIAGIFLLFKMFLLIPQLVFNVGFTIKEDSKDALFIVAMSLLTIATYLFFIWLLVLKTEIIVNKFGVSEKLEQELIHFKIHRATVLKIAIVVIGVLIIVDEIPKIIMSAVNIISEVVQS